MTSHPGRTHRTISKAVAHALTGKRSAIILQTAEAVESVRRGIWQDQIRSYGIALLTAEEAHATCYDLRTLRPRNPGDPVSYFVDHDCIARGHGRILRMFHETDLPLDDAARRLIRVAKIGKRLLDEADEWQRIYDDKTVQETADAGDLCDHARRITRNRTLAAEILDACGGNSTVE